MEQFLQILVAGVVAGAVYGMVAVGFTMVFNATQVANFAHGEFVMMGGLISAALIQKGYPMGVSLLIAFAAVTALGVLMDRVAIQRARRKELLTLAMITIGMSVTLRGLMQVVVGRDVLFMSPFPGLPAVQAGGVQLDGQGLWIIGTLVVVSVALWFFFQRSKMGKAMRAASENPRAASLYGISPALMSTLSYAIAALIGAVAGAMITPLSSAFYGSGMFYGLKGFAAAILGGLGNPLGAIVGGLLIGLIENLSAGFLSSGYKDAVALAVLLALLLLRPSGLLGRADAKRV